MRQLSPEPRLQQLPLLGTPGFKKANGASGRSDERNWISFSSGLAFGFFAILGMER